MLSSENKRTLVFTFVLCFVCALLLSTLATLLEEPQLKAKKLDQNRQLLLAAGALNSNGFFQLHGKAAKFENGKLVPSLTFEKASEADILKAYAALIKPMVVNDEGELFTFQEAHLDFESYISNNQKKGYADLPFKLVYLIGENEGYVIPINGYGLWDAIYGYLALASDGNTVLGATWYSQAETAGLGAVIAEPSWQAQFPGKVIFQPSANGSTDFARASLGITVVKGTVNQNSPKARTSVDGITGATLTGNGVTNAYADCLAQYRPFLQRMHQ